MALIAETVGAQPIDFGDGVGSVMKGADAAAGLYAAKQKAEQAGLQLEDMRLKQDQMKAGIFLGYMDKIKNAPNPAVRKILEKQYANQHQKMYGGSMDPETLKAITETPEFGETIQSLMDQMGVKGAGKNYINAVNNAAKSLGLPYLDALQAIKEGFKLELEEEQNKRAAATAASSAGRGERRLNLMEEKFQRQQNLDVSAALKRAEEDKQFNDYKLQFVGAGKALNIIEDGLKTYRESGGKQTVPYSQLTEIMTDLAQLAAIKPSAVVPVSRQKELGVDIPVFNKMIGELEREVKTAPSKNVPVSLLTMYKQQLGKMQKYLDIAMENEFDTSLKREETAGIITPEQSEAHKNQALQRLRTQGEQALIETGVKEKLTVRQMIQRGMSYNEISGKLPKDLRGMFTKDKYDQAVNEMKAQKGK